MKKFSIMLLSALALASFTACDEAPAEPPMQSNPEEPVLAVGDITTTPSAILSTTEVISLQNYVDDPLIPVLTLDQTKNLPSGSDVKYYFQLSPNADFSGNVQTLDIEFIDSNEGFIDATRWHEAQVAMFGKNPEKARETYFRIPVYVTLDGTEYRYESPDYYVAKGKFDVKCIDTGFVIYPSYYLIGDFCGWDLSKMVQLKHSDADVYDDPIFSIVVEVSANCYWKVANNLAFEQQSWDGAYYWGPAEDGDENLVGKLVNPCMAGKIVEAGKYKFTFNMESMDYTIEPFNRPEYLCTPGGSNGWSQPASQYLYYTEKDGAGFFYGLIAVDGGFKFTDGNSWDNDKTWGAGEGEGTLTQPGSDINLPGGKGLYWIQVDLETNTFKAVKVESLGVIGAGDWNTQRNLTPNADNTVWTGDIAVSGGWKIRINDDWAYNLGGDMANPNLDGGDFTAEGSHVTVDLTHNWPIITVY